MAESQILITVLRHGTHMSYKFMVKDQTYFLSHLSQSQLKRFLSPLGCIPKGNRAIVVDEPEVTRDHFYGRAYLLAMPLGYPTKADMQTSGLVISASLGGPAYRTSVSSVMLSWQLMIQAEKTWDGIIRCS
ncbi:hypothetical protein VNO78_20011 [Psophocarpus tetragonolobus]|uniref:Uncharacterized protein n=1 Tax=Psophocarpus tetragonolobus TaxID=3891 RepID=A0AAN9S8N0_PSOTE